MEKLIETKTCKFCKWDLPLDCFGSRYYKKKKRYRMHSNCARCMQQKNRDYRKDPSYCRKTYKASRQKYKDDPRQLLWQGARNRCRRNNLVFDIRKEDIIIPEFCPILKIPLKSNNGKPWDYSPSLDRVNNDLGYTKDNIKVISRLANSMKNSASPELLKMFSENIIKYINNE